MTIYFIKGDMWSGEFELFHHFYFQSPEKSTAVKTAIIIIAIIVIALASLMTIYFIRKFVILRRQ